MKCKLQQNNLNKTNKTRVTLQAYYAFTFLCILFPFIELSFEGILLFSLFSMLYSKSSRNISNFLFMNTADSPCTNN